MVIKAKKTYLEPEIHSRSIVRKARTRPPPRMKKDPWTQGRMRVA